jgi:hypothetical protein
LQNPHGSALKGFEAAHERQPLDGVQALENFDVNLQAGPASGHTTPKSNDPVEASPCI